MQLRLDKWKLRSTILFIMFQLYQEWSAHKVNTIENSVCFWKLRWEILFCTKKKEWNEITGFHIIRDSALLRLLWKKKKQNQLLQKLIFWSTEMLRNWLNDFNMYIIFSNCLMLLDFSLTLCISQWSKHRQGSCTRVLSEAHLRAVGLFTFPTPLSAVKNTELKSDTYIQQITTLRDKSFVYP